MAPESTHMSDVSSQCPVFCMFHFLSYVSVCLLFYFGFCKLSHSLQMLLLQLQNTCIIFATLQNKAQWRNVRPSTKVNNFILCLKYVSLWLCKAAHRHSRVGLKKRLLINERGSQGRRNSLFHSSPSNKHFLRDPIVWTDASWVALFTDFNCSGDLWVKHPVVITPQ